MAKDPYADAGVNLELGDKASEILYNAAKLTWKNRKGKFGEVIEPFPDFSSFRGVHVGGLPIGTIMNLGLDGVGTKVELGERCFKHDTVALDLFAMVCDDAVVRGAEPVLVGSILDVKSLGGENKPYINFVKQLALGYIKAASEANVVVVNGEIAELGARIQGFGEFNYNWGAAVVWFAKKERAFTGKKVKVGDTLVGLKEKGFRSNGLSLVRKVFGEKYGENWHEKDFSGSKIGELVLTPSCIYTRAVVDMFGGFNGEPKVELNGAAHITGGGLPGKVGRMLKPTGFGALIDNPFLPSDLMLHCQEAGKVSDAVAYKTWNMGQGMVIATPDPNGVIDVALSHGIEAKKVGKVVNNPRILIKSNGFFSKGQTLEF